MSTELPDQQGLGAGYPSRVAAGVDGLLGQITRICGDGPSVTDIHIEQDQPMMVRSPRGWMEVSGGPIGEDRMYPLLLSIDEDWKAKLGLGSIDRPLLLPTSRLRCNVFGTRGGQKIAISLRRLPLRPLPFERTGLPLYLRAAALEATRGLLLVTGPTGSGKTTSIASMLDHVNSQRNSHIVTIEQPIEYELVRKQGIVSQKEVPIDTPTFAAGLRDALRQKPDVIMVGEVRDPDTADTVLHAGESGHLVLATMHTSSAAGAIAKLLSFFPADQRDRRASTLASTLIGVVCQSLVPADADDGYVLASELILNNHQQAAPFIADPGKAHLLTDFMRRKEDNMSRSLNDNLAQLVAGKKISSKDAMRATYNRAELHEMLQQMR